MKGVTVGKMRLLYPDVDLARTGAMLKDQIQSAGYTVKDIQQYLMLSCPQPIYRWYSGKILPSVNHLYAISRLLGVHMEELIVAKTLSATEEKFLACEKRMLAYWKVLGSAV